MTKEEAMRAIELHEALVSRFIEVIGDVPDEGRYASVSIEGEEATLMWPEVFSDELESVSRTIPAARLFLSDDEFAEWRRVQRAIYERKQLEEQRDFARTQEVKERNTLARLKAKYEEGV